MYGCAFLAFFVLFFPVTFSMPIARGAGIFSGSGQRLIFLITFFLYILFFSWVSIPGGVLLYSLRFLWGLFDLNFGLGAQAGGGG